MPFDLNEEQQAAVSALRGPVIISAGAGSGKTRTLSERFAHALAVDAEEEWDGTTPSRILTITFTEKAAGELAERIRSTLRATGQRKSAREIDNAWISTIHGFCSRILRRYALEAGLDPSFSVVETVAAARLRDHAFEQAAAEVLETSDGEVLFGDFEFSAIYDAVEIIAHALRTRGLSASSLNLEQPRDGLDIYRTAVQVLREAAPRIAECGDEGKSAASFCEKCALAFAQLSGLEPEALGPDELMQKTWQVLAEVKPGRTSQKIRDTHEAICDEVRTLTGEAAASASAVYSRALVHLVGAFMAAYATAKRAQGLLDFDDLQSEALRLFERNPAVLAECRDLFALSMVDEFQDTDALQLALVEAVAGEHLCTVGDEHQSIYGFRGADIDVFRKHEKTMLEKGARKKSLFANYRSHRDILAFVNTLFSHEALFGDDLKHLTPGRIEPETPRMPEGQPRIDLAVVHKTQGQGDLYLQEEARVVARRFAVLRDEFGFKAGDMVLLSRTYKHAEVYAGELRAQGFDVSVVGGSRFLTLPEVITARMVLRAIANPRDEVALLHVLSSDAGRVSDDALLQLRSIAGGLWAALQEPTDELDSRDDSRVRNVVDTLRRAQGRLGHVALSEIILRATEELGLDLLYLSRGDVGRQAYANVLKLARLAAAFEDGGGSGPAAFAAQLDAREEYGEHTPPATLADDQSSSVRFMSMHSAKGLEFPVVAVVGLGSGVQGDSKIVRVGVAEGGAGLVLSARLPSLKTTREKAERPALFAHLDEAARKAEAQEGRRLFYVAATRAREVLVLSGVANMEKGPSEAETMLNWLRTALPELDAPVGEGPRIREIGECLVRTESIEAAGTATGKSEVARQEPREPKMAQRCIPMQGATLPVPDQLSYTDLALYGECAKRFWASRVLRVGSLAADKESDQRRAGSVLHAILQLARDGMPDDERIEAIARYHRLSPVETEQIRAAAARFLTSPVGLRLAKHKRVRREWSFAVDLSSGDEQLMLAGAIDAYGRTGDEGLIVDYKSGTSGDEGGLRDRYELQARCYALVALKDGCRTVHVVFSRPEAVGVDGECQEVEYEFAARDLEKIETQLRETHAMMRAGEYSPLKKWDAHVCNDCPILGSLCAVRAPKRR